MSDTFLLLLIPSGVVFIYLLMYINKKPHVGVYVFVFLSSITMMPNLPVVGSRLVVADFVMIYTIFVAILKGHIFRHPPPGTGKIDQLALIFIFLCVLSSLVALIDGIDPIRVTLFLLIYVYGYMCFRLIVRLIDTVDKFRDLCLFWGAGAVLVTVVGFMASTGIFRPEWTYDPIINRISSTMKSSGQVSSYLGPAFFIFAFASMSPSLDSWKRGISIVLMGMGVVVLLGTGSRISFVIILFLIAYLLFTIFTVNGRVLRKLPFLISVAIGMIALLFYVSSIWSDDSKEYSLLGTSPFERAIRIFSETKSNQNAGLAEWGGTRYSEITVALDSIWENPIFGTGSGMFSQTYKMNEIHNTYISILAENGVPAFIFMIIWWVSIGIFLQRRIIQSKSAEGKFITKLVLGAFLVLVVYQLTTNGLRQRPFWFIPAVALAGVAAIRRIEDMKTTSNEAGLHDKNMRPLRS